MTREYRPRDPLCPLLPLGTLGINFQELFNIP